MLFEDVIVRCYANGENKGKLSFNAASFTLIQLLLEDVILRGYKYKWRERREG